MPFPIQVTFHDLTHSVALESLIRDRAARLELYSADILACRVVVEMPQKKKHQGKLYNLRIELAVPQGEVAVNRHAREDVHVAIRDAFDAARRRLEDRVRHKQGEVKRHADLRHGTVSRIFRSEGFGFLETPEGEELYFSSDNLASPSFRSLEEGMEVQFIEEAGDEGLQAKRISAGKHHVPL